MESEGHQHLPDLSRTRVLCLGFRVWGLGFEVLGFGVYTITLGLGGMLRVGL